MKITKTQLKQIIKEEIKAVLAEAPTSQFADPGFEELPDAPMGGPVAGAAEAEAEKQAARAQKKREEIIKVINLVKAVNEQCADARDRNACLGSYAGQGYQQFASMNPDEVQRMDYAKIVRIWRSLP